jgi:CHAD domain-containing protein
VEPQLEKEYLMKDFVALREVGRKICGWRDSSVLRRNLKEFKKEFPDLLSDLGGNDKISLILKKTDKSAGSEKISAAESEEINYLLKRTGFRVRFQTMNKLDPNLLLRELEMTYERVTDKYLACRNNPKPDKIHEFRKRAKDFLYQLYFFEPVNPASIRKVEKKLDSLTRNLGRYNDLNQLILALDYEYSFERYPPVLDELVVRIREKQDRYLSKVWPQAYSLFCPGQKMVNLLGFKLLVF